MSSLQRIFLIGIILLASVLRFWQLGSLPPSLYWDEVSQAYNAYSILQTGKDEHKEVFPVARFKAFGDYKAPVNIYLMVPSIALFGKTEFAVRFPSAFLGTLTVVMTYLLVTALFLKDKNNKTIGLLAALFLAVSPWHIQLSRAAYEANIATFFTVTGLFLFFLALNKGKIYFILSLISFVMAMYAFNSHRVFIPLLLMLLCGVYWRRLLEYKNKIVIAGVIAGVFFLPLFLFLQTPESKLRFKEVNIFTDLDVITASNTYSAEDNNSFVSKVIHNRRVIYTREFVSNYFDFYNPEYLFFKGDQNPRFSHQFNGQLYLWMLPLIVFGIYFLTKKFSRESFFVIFWILLAPLVAATARETPHALRSETFIPSFEIVAAIGCYGIWQGMVKKFPRFGRGSYGIGICIVIFSVITFWHNYSSHFPMLFSSDWQYGYKETFLAVKEYEKTADKIYVTSLYGRPHIYLAWYGNIHPQEYWDKAVVERDTFGFYNVRSVGKYIFVSSLPKVISEKSLVVVAKEELPSNMSIIKEFNFLNGNPAFVIAKPAL